MAEWQPIETAPRDGTAVLIYGESFDVEAARRPKPLNIVVGYFQRDSIEAGWMSDIMNDDYEIMTPVILYPTHWMPLPDVPPA